MLRAVIRIVTLTFIHLHFTLIDKFVYIYIYIVTFSILSSAKQFRGSIQTISQLNVVQKCDLYLSMFPV